MAYRNAVTEDAPTATLRAVATTSATTAAANTVRRPNRPSAEYRLVIGVYAEPSDSR
jgi:hypothetical protein